MKKLKLILILIFIASISFSQETEEKAEINSLIKNPPKKVTGFLSPVITLGSIGGETAYYQGLGGAVLINNRFFIGGYENSIENNVSTTVGSDTYEINYQSRGLWVGYNFFSEKVVHFSVSAFAGKGEINLHENNLDVWLYDDIIFEIAPIIEIEFNVTKFFKIGIGGTYKLALDVDQFTMLADSDFSGPGGFASLKFGWFY